MLNRLLNSTGRKLKLYIHPPLQATPAAEAVAKPASRARKPAAGPEGSLAEALSCVETCSSPEQAIAALEAAGISPQRAAVLGGVSLSTYKALRRAAPDSSDWQTFRENVMAWKARIEHG